MASWVTLCAICRGKAWLIGVNLTLAWRLKPQLHKLAPAYAGYQTLDFPLVRAGGLGFYSSEFHSPELKLTPMGMACPYEDSVLSQKMGKSWSASHRAMARRENANPVISTNPDESHLYPYPLHLPPPWLPESADPRHPIDA